MRRFFSMLFLLSAVLAVAGAGAGLWIYGEFTKPGPLASDTVIIIEPGSGVSTIARQLASNGVIADALVFQLGARFLSDETAMKAGEFLFPERTSGRDAVRLLQYGKTVVHRITFAEGLTSFEIAEQLARTKGLVGTLAAPVPEGVLLPETYHFSYGGRRADMIQRMRENMAQLIADLWAGREQGLPFASPQEAVVLASIVEKETGVASERARVAGVFINRLRKGMRLQSDPTVVYGLTNGKGPLGRPLRRSELKRETAYNTYVIKALPPTPIANPGREALHAVLHPMQTDEFYFVADGSGGHVFAKTLAEHNRNVARWRKIEKDRKSGG
ncbi:MAG: endolytic transglycosylase MltG [Rhodospirillales bacterium]|nr:endolytic transglycosylase MltG [Rhodospirillales bacterium]